MVECVERSSRSARLPVVRRSLHALAAVALLALSLALAACSSAPTEEPAPTTTAESTPGPQPDAAVGDALEAFVKAAGDGDVAGMWNLLAADTKQRLGPSQEDFERRYADGFESGLGSFSGTDYRIVVSATTPSRWGVAAIAGERVREKKTEFAAYAAMLRQEDGWKIVLDEPVEISSVAPPGKSTDEVRPQVGVRIRANEAIDEAGLWLDGTPVPARVRAASGNDIRVEGPSPVELSPGWHVVVAFGRAGDAASAAARPLQVDGAGGPVA